MFKTRHCLQILGIVLLLAIFAAAQQLSLPDNPRWVFHRVGEEIGLGTITATSMVQDPTGYMWIGTQDGFLRYDGTHVRRYGLKEGIPTSYIDQAIITPKGRVVVAGRKGLALQDDTRFIPLAFAEGVTANPGYQYIAADQHGNIYIATRKGLLRTNEQGLPQPVNVPIHGEKDPVSIDVIYAAPDGRMWFAAKQHLGQIGRDGQGEMLPFTGIPEGPILSLAIDGQRRMWLRTATALYYLLPGETEFRPGPKDIPNANDSGPLYVDHQGNLLVLTVAGIYRHVHDRWEAIDRNRGLGLNAAYSVTQDYEGSYWIGLAGAGVERWQGDSGWQGWTMAEGLPDNGIWSVKRDAQKRLWVGTNNGVGMWDAKARKWRIWRAANGLNGAVVRDMVPASDGSMWVLSFPNGLTRFDPVTLKATKVTTPTPQPVTITKGLDGRVWISNSRYVKALKSTSAPYEFEDVQLPPELKGCTSHLQVVGSVLWGSGKEGLARYDGKTVQRFGTKDGLKEDLISEIAAVSGDELWFHYDEAYGLARVRIVNGKADIRHFTTADGLASDTTYMLGVDHEQNIWAGGPFGLTEFKRDGHVNHYTRSDGLIWDDLNAGAFLADEDGGLIFGTSSGLAHFDPKSATRARPDYRPKTVITSLVLGGKERSLDTVARVANKENTLLAQFATLSFQDSARTRCFYRMHGLENDYNETDTEEARYPALPHGSYRFEVFCKTAAGIVTAPAIYSFEVAPAWYQRWDMRLIAIAMLLLAMAAAVHLRLRRLESERRRLEAAVAERSAELAQANLELKEASLTDALTACRNRRFFDVVIHPDVIQATRAYHPPAGMPQARNRDLIFYIIDIDHFKQVNDEFGHLAGDQLLIEFSKRVSAVIRQSDVLIRWGGEEFLLVSRAAERSEAMTLATRVLSAVATDPYELPGAKQPVYRTCSIGWAPFPWFSDRPDLVGYESILKMADRALYRAKESGRNRAYGVLPIGKGAGIQTLSNDTLKFEWASVEGPEQTKAAKADL